MNRVDRYKILVRYLVSIGVAASQKDLGRKLGYNNESAFSQVINEKAPRPKDFMSKLKELLPDLNEDWIENGNGDMISVDNSGGQVFNGDINGGDNKFSGRDMTINPPCDFGIQIDRVISAMTSQANLTKEAMDLTREAQAQTRKAQEQMDRLLSIIETKFK
nr:MAG TPA: repressor protein CI [Caudoviricetes sp.]